MKKSKYINKYDFIAYYTKQKEMWFFSNSEIQSGIDAILKKNKSFESYEFDEKNDDYNEGESIDSYEYYSQLKLENENIDEENPLIVEGNIIDQLSKEKIINEYKVEQIIDFDNYFYKSKKMERLAEITKNILSKYESIIIFQPVFIHENTITKPDALIKKNNLISIVETKGTTTSKPHHLLDLFFQKKVLDNQDFLKKYKKKFLLCLIEYKRMNKNEISFVITPYTNITKSITFTKDDSLSDEEKINQKQMMKIGKWFTKKNPDLIFPIEITEILNNNWEKFNIRYENINLIKSKESLDKFYKEFSLVINEFENVINKLQEHKNKMTDKDYPINFKPSEQDKSFFKNSEYWYSLKYIYVENGYDLYKYSGNVMKQTLEEILNYKKHDNLEEYIKMKKKDIVIKCYLSEKKVNINEVNSFNYLNKIKPNKVYFDFESINTAIRNVDNSLPFNQIVSQCSIVKYKKNDSLDDLFADNLIIDPKLINNDWFKKIINSIYTIGDNSYIVYNKSFEKSRIKEMIFFINEKEYELKGNKIIDNLYDLADFFTPSKEMILIKELYGYYSIKKVISLIEKYNKNLLLITKSKNYNELQISNGLLCQKETTLRFFSKINDDEWKKISKELEAYCENDVRSMIAVELFIKYILENKKLEK